MASTLLKQFLKNTAGNFSMIGAVMTTSAVSIIGLGVDMQRNYAIKSSLQSAVDAAALSGALVKTSFGEDATFGERRKAALQSLKTNTKNLDFIENPNVAIDPFTGTISVEARAKTDYLIMSLFGHENKILSAQGKAAYGEALNGSGDAGNIPTIPSGPDSTESPPDSVPPISIAFVLDNSTSLLETFNGKSSKAGGPANNTATTRLDLLKDTAAEFYASLDRMSRANPQLRQSIRTGLMPYNDGLDRQYQVGLQQGWGRTATQTSIMRPKRRTLPVESFNQALKQLNTDRKTNTTNARKVIVFMGDGDFDAGFKAKPETDRLMESCQSAKESGVEIYVFTLDVKDNDSLSPYQICASPNGSISGYGPFQSTIDAQCSRAVISTEQDSCRQRKTEYFSQITSPDDLDKFWARLNPNRSPAPIANAPDPNNANNQEARVRLVE